MRPVRIETGVLEEAKVHIDPFGDPREQLAEIVKKLIYVLPLKFDKVKVAVKNRGKCGIEPPCRDCQNCWLFRRIVSIYKHIYTQ